MSLEDLVDKEAYRKIDGDTCLPNIVYIDAETHQFLESYYEPRGFKEDQITHHYKYNGTLFCWYKRTPEEKGERPYKCKTCGHELGNTEDYGHAKDPEFYINIEDMRGNDI